MEDVFKVILYAAAIIIWIIYKARQQQKSGMWKPRTGQVPEEAGPVIPAPASYSKPVIRKEAPKKTTIFKTPAPKVKSYEKNYENYQNPEFNKKTNAVNDEINAIALPESEMTDTHEEVFNFDLRQAVISSEILKRPAW